jgi:hypothetical protein
MPSVPPPGGQQNRTALYVTLGVLAAVVLVVVAIAMTSGGDDDSPAAQGTTTTADEPATTDSTDPGIDPGDIDLPGEETTDGLDTTDEGFSTFPDPYDGTDTYGSYGFLVENTADHVIANAEISVTVKDTAGGIVTTDTIYLGAIQAGDTLGYGKVLTDGNLANGIGSIDIQIGESAFGASDVPDGKLTVANVTTTGDDTTTTTTFSVASTYDQEITNPSPYVIFRDASGKIIGGDFGLMDFIPADGEQSGQVDTYAKIPNIATSEIYVDPGSFY